MTMIKGVNHRVIEVSRPESAYFERAVLFLRPELSDSLLQTAELEAEHFLGDVSPIRRHFRLRAWFWFALGMAVSGGAAGAFFLLH